jgi:pyrroloquinoline-quinone synthase
MTPSRAPRVAACANQIIRRVGLLQNPYFTSLADGSMSKEAFRASQEQFFFAVRYFPRPMAALIARMPDPLSRLDILHNLVEEHGDFRQDQFHQNTFRAFLGSIGAGNPEAAGIRVWPAVLAFNGVLMAAAACDEIEVGVGCLGIIERAFADVSALIGQAVTHQGWVAAAELVHYAIHAELDIRHAEEFFAVVEPNWDDIGRRLLIEQGLELGAYAFNRLYLDLAQGSDAVLPRLR